MRGTLSLVLVQTDKYRTMHCRSYPLLPYSPSKGSLQRDIRYEHRGPPTSSAMTNWNDPSTLVNQLQNFTRLQHVLSGIYIWEIVTDLRHDWSLIKTSNGSKAPPWVKWTYLACRYFTLVSLLLLLITYNVTTAVDCQVLAIWIFACSFASIQLASILIAIRVVAIWRYNKYFVVAVSLGLCTQFGFLVHEVTQFHSSWNPMEKICVDAHTETSRANNTVTLVVDLFLLVSMLVGLFRWKHANQCGLWKFLWNQGLIWFTLAMIIEIPIVAFAWLNLNQVMNTMFLTPGLIVLVISATRMYRSLSEFTKSFDPTVDTTNGPRVAAKASSMRFASLDSVQMQRIPHDVESSRSRWYSSSAIPNEVSVHQTVE